MTKKRHYRLIAVIAALFISYSSFSQIRINEIQSVNGNVISDEDGDYEDWIEIVNTSTTQDINLQDYYLSDDNNYTKWKFPSYILKKKTGSEFERILVFASGKNRYEMTDHWELLVNNTDTWKYFATTNTNVPSNWYLNQNTNWATGSGYFGYGYSVVNQSVPAGTIALYIQKNFSIADINQIENLVLSCDYDDGFVAYINGVEVARDNIGSVGVPVNYNTLATYSINAQINSVNGKPRSFVIPKSVWSSFLVNGSNNKLSIEVHNYSGTSSDLLVYAFLSAEYKTSSSSYIPVPSWFPYKPKYFHTNFKIESSGETISLTKQGIAQSVVVPGMSINTSYGRKPDGTDNFFQSLYPSTPKATNNSSTAYAGYTQKPIITLNSGFYNSPQMVAITSNETGSFHIRYTTNGNIPKLTDKLYTVPISVDSTMVLKARVFMNDNSKYPGTVATATFYINCPTSLPVISITVDSLDLYDWNNGIYVKGPNAASAYPYKGANFWQDWEKPAYVEYLDDSANNRIMRFSTDGLIGIFGNYTRAKPQKSWDFKVQSLYDTAGINYQIFPERTKKNYKNLVFRNAGSDWMKGHIRDEFLHKVTYNDGIFSTSSKPVVCYLNGKYWGVYHVREKGDEKFLASISDFDKDSIDQIFTSGSDDAKNGNTTAFNNMVNFIRNNDMSILSNYNIAKSMWNMDNYLTYFALEMYAHNDDWISVYKGEYWFNNIKLWRPRGVTNAKWNYQLHDIDLGVQNNLVNYKTIDTVFAAGNLSSHSLILNKFKTNTEFKRRFINKFFDLFNTTLKKDTLNNILTNMFNKYKPELNRMSNQWPENPGMSNISQNSESLIIGQIQNIRQFISQRELIIRNQLVSHFNLPNSDTANITIGVAPSSIGKGKVKLNSLKPTDQYWSGTYLKSNPVEIEAIAEPGYVFHYWSPSLSFAADSNNMVMIKSVSSGDSLIANFKVAPKIAITELNYKSDPTRNSGDWIELYNNGPIAINIGGWKIKKTSDYKSYTIPNFTILNPGAFLVLVSDTDDFCPIFPGVTNREGSTLLDFNDDGDVLLLTDNKDNVMLRFAYSDTNSWPDCAKGLGRTLQIVDPNLNPSKGTSWTCGCMGGSPGWAYINPCPERIIFNEINYNSLATTDVGDWVELYNKSWDTINLSGWIFKDGLDDHAFVFPQNTIINPYGYLVLVENLSRFNTRFGGYNHIKKLGPFTWKLNGDKEAIRLYDNTGKIYQSMYYKDKAPWPTKPNGFGWTLQLIDPSLNPTSPYSWIDSCIYGTPGSGIISNCSAYSVDEFEKDKQILVYPNPAFDLIYIKIKPESNENSVLQIFDLQGRLVVSEKLKESDIQEISIASLQKGMYLYIITNSKTILGTGKLLKQ